MFVNIVKGIADAVNRAKKEEADKKAEAERKALELKAKKLLDILTEATALKEYLKGWDGKTHERKYSNGQLVTYCNVLSRDLLDSTCPKIWIMGWHIGGENAQVDGYDYDISAINPDKKIADIILSTGIPSCYNNLKKAGEAGIVKLLTPEQAQKRANEGVPIHVVSAKYNHEAIVCPDSNPYNPARGPKIGQAGYYNGIFYISEKQSWGGWWTDPELIYVEYPLRKVA